MTDLPLVSVIMPVFHHEQYIQEAIDSIINQTYRKFELLILVDDPSDKTQKILDEYEKTDERIKVFYDSHLGLINSLNKGIRLAQGKYIARMDADDICLPKRFQRQVEYLESNNGITLLGTGAYLINCDDKLLQIIRPPIKPYIIRWHLIFSNCFIHSSVFFKRDEAACLGYYRNGANYVEDYDFWSRICDVYDVANLQEVLMINRIRENSVSSQYSTNQIENGARVSYTNIIKYLGTGVSPGLVTNVHSMLAGNTKMDKINLENTLQLLSDITEKFIEVNDLNRRETQQLDRYLAEYYILIAKASWGILSTLETFKVLSLAMKHNPFIPYQILTSKISLTIKKARFKIN